MKQYNVDVRAVNVETGAILAKDGAEWNEGSSYRQMMRSLAERLSKNIPLVEFRQKQPPVEKKEDVKNNDLYRPTGPLLKFDLGLPTGIAIGYQVTPWLMLGGGVGVCCGYGRTGSFNYGYVPLFVEARFSTPRYKWSLFCDVKGGGLVVGQERKDPIFVAIESGFIYKRFSARLGIRVGIEYFCPMIGISYDLPLDFDSFF